MIVRGVAISVGAQSFIINLKRQKGETCNMQAGTIGNYKARKVKWGDISE